MAYTRTEFDAARLRAKGAAERLARQLAIVAVLGGVFQLVFIRWADRSLDAGLRLWLEGGVFVLYIVVIVILLRRLLVSQRDGAIRCPACGARLERSSLAVASATGRCEKCGGAVIQ
jgi:hypothetical protein